MFMLCSFTCPGDCDPHQNSIILCVKQETLREERPRGTFPAGLLEKKGLGYGLRSPGSG